MRKYIKGICLLLALTLLIGCGATSTPPASQGETDGVTVDTTKGYQAEFSTENKSETSTDNMTDSQPETLDYVAKYVPIGEKVYCDPSFVPEKEVICSADELKEFYERWDEFYDLEQTAMFPQMPGFRETAEQYDEAFWQEHDLIVFGSAQTSGSIRHNVTEIRRADGTGDWIVEVEQLIPLGLNELIQSWFIVIEVPKGEIEDEEQLEIQWYEVYEVKAEGEESEVPKEIKVPLSAQYIRTGELASYEGEPKRAFRVVRSADELEAYYEEYKDVYYLGRNEAVYMDRTIGFLDACDRFDETFWEQYDLVLTATLEPSGSIRHEVVNMVSTDGGSEWVINARVISPDLQTCDMAFWYFLIEVPKGMIEETDKVTFKAVYDTDREGLYSGNVQYIRTDNYVDLDEEKRPYFFLESREELMEYCEAHGVSAGFIDACDKYDEVFWKYNKLLVVLTMESSGSIRHEAVELFKNKLYDDEWYLRIKRLTPEVCTDDVALWHILIKISTYDYGTGETVERIGQQEEINVVYIDTPVEEKSLYRAQYIRTDLGTVEVGEPIIELICSQEELDAYYEANKNRYELVWRDWESREQTYGFLDACERFTPLFWEQHDLIMIVLQEPNKWTRHEVSSIVFTEEIPQKYKITITRITGQESDESANWHILLPMPKGQVWGEEYVNLSFAEVCTGEK